MSMNTSNVAFDAFTPDSQATQLCEDPAESAESELESLPMIINTADNAARAR